VDEYCLAKPNPRHQEENGVDDVSGDRNTAPDRRPTVEGCRNLLYE